VSDHEQEFIDTDFIEWLKANPAPDLQKMVRRFGTYADIPAEVWDRYDRAMVAWQQRRLERLRKMTIESWRLFNEERQRLAASGAFGSEYTPEPQPPRRARAGC
jgi:hypothetical protein